MSNIQDNEKLLETYKLQLDQINELLQNDPKNEEYLSIHNQLQEAISLLEELTSDKPKVLTKRPLSDLIDWKLGDTCQVKLSKLQNQWMSGAITNLTADKSIATILLQKSHETIQLPIHELIRPKKLNTPIHDDLLKPTPIKKQTDEQRRKRKKSQQEYQERKNQEHSGKAEAWKSFQSKLMNKTSPSIFHPAQHESIFKTCPEKSKTTSIITKRKHVYSKDFENE